RRAGSTADHRRVGCLPGAEADLEATDPRARVRSIRVIDRSANELGLGEAGALRLLHEERMLAVGENHVRSSAHWDCVHRPIISIAGWCTPAHRTGVCRASDES